MAARYSSVLLSVLFVLLCVASPALAAGEGDGHRLIGLLDYIGADYSMAVEQGEVIDEFEYNEMKTLGSEAAALTGSFDELDDKIANLREAIDDKASVETVRDRALEARQLAVERFEVDLHPTSAPDFDAGKALYEANCASCHGSDGAADVPGADDMKPAPTDFTDPDTRADLSPYRVFNTSTFGIEETAMRSFSELTAEERWDIAFYVLSLAHEDNEAAGADTLPEAFDASLEVLASRTDGELEASLAEAGAADGALSSQLSYLRRDAPFGDGSQATDEAFALINSELRAAEEAWAAGDFQEARASVMSAYLDGFEPLESRLSAHDDAVTRKTESQFFALRERLEKGDAAGAEAKIELLRAELDEAKQVLESDTSSWTLGIASGIILLREGVEVVLLIGLLLGVLRRAGARRERKYVHGGWVAAMVAGVITWFAASTLIEISGAEREVLEGVVGLLAAGVLFSVTYWFVGKLQGERWMTFIKEQIESKATAGRSLSLAGLAFLAVYREAFETVLFYQALTLDAQGNYAPIFIGAGVAAVLLAAIAVVVLRASVRLPLKPFFAISAALLYALCIVLTGNGIHALAEAGVLPLVSVPFVEVPALGIYPEAFGIAAQGALVLAAVVWLVWSRVRAD